MSMFECSEQLSPISKGVVEIRINSHLAREIIWQHDTREPRRQHEWPPVTMTIKESGQVLPCPSVVFHVKNWPGSPWVAQTLFLLSSMKRGKVSSNSATVESTKFVGFHIACMRQYIINTYCNRAQSTRSWINTGGATTFRASNMKTHHSPPFPSGILHFPLVAPPCLA
jgi:hypothetical protein